MIIFDRLSEYYIFVEIQEALLRVILLDSGRILAANLIVCGFLSIVYGLRNLIIFLVSLEVLFLGFSLDILIASISHFDAKGQILALCILTLAGIESVLGLSIVLLCNRLFGHVSLLAFTNLRG